MTNSREIPKNNNIEKQLEIDFTEKDSKGRTLQEIKKLSRTLDKEILDNIIFKDGEFYIEGRLADEWISERNNLFEKSDDYYKKGDW